MARDSKDLKDLEDLILKQLSGATTEEILDKDDLIIILENSKQKSGEINIRMEESKVVQVEINDTRNLYKPVAIRGSILYFVVADVALIDPMYQNSLAYVKALFNKAIDASELTDVIEQRLTNLIDTITRMIYTNLSRGLFEKDKIIYSFLITTAIKRNAGILDEAVWNILLRGPTVFTSDERAAMLDSPDTQMLPALQWETLISAELRSAGAFDGLSQHIIDNWDQWKGWA